MFQDLSATELLTLAGVGILALSTIVTTVGGAVEKIAKGVKAVRAPEQQQDAKIGEIERRLGKIEATLIMDEKRLDDAKECNHVLTKGMLALLEHGINGNNIDQMRDAKSGVEAYLINH